MEVSTAQPSSILRETRWRLMMLALTAVLGIVVMVALIATLNEANRQRDRALQLQAHSFQVMILARSLATTMAQAEATLGRYVISADKQIGQIYGEQWTSAADQIDQLRSLTIDNDEQQRRIGTLERVYRERSDELAAVALSTRYGKNDQALARYYQVRQSAALARIDTLLDELIARERDQLSRRTATAMSSVARQGEVARILSVFGGLIVIGAIVLGWLTIQALGQRAAARAEAEAERDRAQELERAVATATVQLRQEASERMAAEEKLRQVQKMEAVGQLTGGIAHDFNNMLAVVLGGLELARRQLPDGSPAARHIDSATEGANRAATLTRRLLTFSRAESLTPTDIDPRELIKGMSDLLSRTLGGAIDVNTKSKGQAWSIWADRHQLENALLNLAVNARDAMEGRGKLTITTGSATLSERQIGECAAGDYVTIAVKDSGCGMTPDVLERVFEPFFTTKPIGKGTGLGLSQIFGFVRQSRGEIHISSAPGKGTTVTLYLPRHRVDATKSTGEAEAAPTPDLDASSNARPLDVLVIEDDPRVLAATVGALIELGHRPIACGDPLDAERIADEAGGAIDLIISDVLMPGKTGPEVVADLLRHHPHVPALFVTGFAGDTSNSSDFGQHPVLRKPFTMTALQRAIDQALAANSPGALHPSEAA